MAGLSLAAAPVIDVHCHGWRTRELLAAPPEGFLDRLTMLGMCLLSSDLADQADAAHLARMTASTPLALALARRLAGRLGCSADAAALGEARRAAYAADPVGYLQALWADAGVAALVVDEGYPQPTIPGGELAAAAGLPVHRVARIEPWIAALRDHASGYDELEDAFTATAERALAEGAVAFKSVIAYRTGLDVRAWERSEARAAFTRWRDDGWRERREHAKPVRDMLLGRTLEVAARDGHPVHVHCGGGDPAIVLGHARPQDLFPLLSERLGQPVVLIHSGWPWLEEGAYVASVLPHVYLDLSITLPWASLAIDQKLEVVLGVAPTAKLLYGSDEASEPEVIWFSAHVARAALGRVLGTAVQRDWLTAAEAERIGHGVLGANAARLHGLRVPAGAGA